MLNSLISTDFRPVAEIQLILLLSIVIMKYIGIISILIIIRNNNCYKFIISTIEKSIFMYGISPPIQNSKFEIFFYLQ